ncbi:hypothetical protein [Yinghuangia soli]|uniref:Uncharacterized protein n=1 Tax=Yinghuangia soli TaxID=2908204 RepID=A0AA41PZ01_9ACTN|nr:hypothetical protein [Yinghuangia soli]MCF2528533.1 hypothetical protein [Yinghuangia soli]
MPHDETLAAARDAAPLPLLLPLPVLSPDVSAAVDAVERTFAGYVPGDRGHECPLCFAGSELDLIGARDAPLPDHLVYRAASKADRWDDVPGIVRRVLPPLVRGIATGAVDDYWLTLRGLGRVGWQDWPEDQVRVLRDFFRVWFEDALRRPGTECDADNVLAGCTIATGSATEWLRIWARTRTAAADRQLALAARSWCEDLVDRCPGSLGTLGMYGHEDELAAWLAGSAADRLGAAGAHPELVRRLRLLSVPCVPRDAAAWQQGVVPPCEGRHDDARWADAEELPWRLDLLLPV